MSDLRNRRLEVRALPGALKKASVLPPQTVTLAFFVSAVCPQNVPTGFSSGFLSIHHRIEFAGRFSLSTLQQVGVQVRCCFVLRVPRPESPSCLRLRPASKMPANVADRETSCCQESLQLRGSDARRYGRSSSPRNSHRANEGEQVALPEGQIVRRVLFSSCFRVPQMGSWRFLIKADATADLRR